MKGDDVNFYQNFVKIMIKTMSLKKFTLYVYKDEIPPKKQEIWAKNDDFCEPNGQNNFYKVFFIESSESLK